MEKSFEIKEICTNLRPSKLVVLIHKGPRWQEKCLKIIETFSQIWGGAKNFIVPTDGEKIDEKFWVLLEKFDPDYIYIYNDREGKIRNISDELKKEIFKRLNPFYESRVGKNPIASNFFNSSWPLTFLPDIIPNTEVEEEKIYNPKINYPLIDSPIYIKLLIHSVLGKINDDYCEKLIDSDLEIKEKDFSETDLYSLLTNILWNEESLDYYPSYYSMINTQLYSKGRDSGKVRNAPVLVIVGDSLNDFCLYYNLSSLRYDVFYAPFSIIKSSFSEERYISKLTSFNLALGSVISDKIFYSDSGKKIIFTSISKTKPDLEIIKDKIAEYILIMGELEKDDYIYISKDVNELLPYILNSWEYDNYSNCYREQFIDSKSINQIKTPIPRHFNHRSFDRHYWITEIYIEKYKLPPYAILSESLEEHLYSNHDIRITKNGFAYFCPFVAFMGESIDKYLARPYIKLFSPFKIAKKIFEELEYNISTSDKGNYERESIEKFGSLELAAKYLMKEEYQNLFGNFVKKGNPSSPDEGIFLNDDSRMYMSLKSIENILGEEINTVVNEFIQKRILHRGFIFKCEKCKHTGWYDIEDVKITFKCRRCRKIQYYESKHLTRQNPIEPEWFYKLDEAVYQGYANDMIVPILTLNNLKNSTNESFLYTNEIEISKKESPEIPYREIDIFCISDGKLIIGECKRDNKLAFDEIVKYKDIYKETNAEKIIFSTFDDEGWSYGTLERFKEILGDEINYELFNKDNLV
jgi:hypothetical protein